MKTNKICRLILIYRLYRKSPYMENLSLYKEIKSKQVNKNDPILLIYSVHKRYLYVEINLPYNEFYIYLGFKNRDIKALLIR